MRRSMGVSVLIALAALVDLARSFESPPAVRRYDDGPLTPREFTGQASANATDFAFTYSYFDYSYRHQRSVTAKGVRLQLTGMTAQAVFVPDKSWNRTPGDPRLLSHEQGHFDLTQIHALRWQQRMTEQIKKSGVAFEGRDEAAATAALQARFRDDLAELNKVWDAEQRRYDKETERGLNRARQREWRERIDAELKSLQAPAKPKA